VGAAQWTGVISSEGQVLVEGCPCRVRLNTWPYLQRDTAPSKFTLHTAGRVWGARPPIKDLLPPQEKIDVSHWELGANPPCWVDDNDTMR